jgi:hypothetical protein
VDFSRNLLFNSALSGGNAIILLVYSEGHTPMLLLEMLNRAVLEILLKFYKPVKVVISDALRILVYYGNRLEIGFFTLIVFTVTAISCEV